MRIAFYPVSDGELKAAIKAMKIIVDTREQSNSHLTDYFKAKKIGYDVRKLEYGDYSLELPLKIEGAPPCVSLEKKIVIERKHSIDEIVTNLGSDRDRFEKELVRIKADGAKCILFLENFSFDRVLMGSAAGGYRSQMPPDQIILNLNQMIVRYDLHLVTLNDRVHSGRLLTSLLARHAYEYLKGS